MSNEKKPQETGLEFLICTFLAGAFFVYVFGSGPGFWVGVAAMALSGLGLAGFGVIFVQSYKELKAEMEGQKTDLKGQETPQRGGET